MPFFLSTWYSKGSSFALHSSSGVSLLSTIDDGRMIADETGRSRAVSKLVGAQPASQARASELASQRFGVDVRY